MGARSIRPRSAIKSSKTALTALNTNSPGQAFSGAPTSPASREDKRRWKGFCEIESEPALFNAMLKAFGVRGVKVQEIVSLDDEILAFLPKPVYGLIFLFKWTEEDSEKQERSCPEEVWFANQTVNNACASVALINIVNNVPGADLGDHLKEFKDFTADFSPALRGDAIGNFEFVKEIHNSFARKMDMLNTDLLLKNEATAKQKGKKSRPDEDDHEAGFHFIAFMPIGDNLWKLDGLERQPMCLDCVGDDWLSQLKPDLEARMARYEEGQIEFAILSLVKDPLSILVLSLARNVKGISALTVRLDEIGKDWREFTIFHANGNSDDLLHTADRAYGLTHEDISQAEVPELVVNVLTRDNVQEIIEARQTLISSQAELRRDIREELQSLMSDEEKAIARSRDLGAKMQNFARKVKLGEGGT